MGTILERMAAIESSHHVIGDLGMAKVSKTKVEYQDHPNNRQKCELCTMFRAPGSCTYVAGHIARRGWCTAFDRLGKAAKR